MRKLYIFTVVVTLCSFSFAQTQKLGWSTGYYTSWSQGGYPPSKIPWRSFTHICQFALIPNSSGGVGGLTDAACTALVTEAHKNGVKALICVGGGGTGAAFVSASSAANRTTFIANVVNFMKKYGYDGVDLDWEEVNGATTSFVALYKEMRAALDKISPRPMLTSAMADYLAPECAQTWPYCDQMNAMCYWTRASGMDKFMAPLLSAGVPKSKLGVGMGFATADGELDTDPASVKAKILYAMNNGYGGVMQWAIDQDAARNGGKTPSLDTIAHYIVRTPTLVMSTNGTRYTKEVCLAVKSDRTTGLSEIRYTVLPAADGSGAAVDLSLFDLKGALIKTFVHGRSTPGVYTVRLGDGASIHPGTYIVRLTTGSSIEASKAFIFK